MNIAILIVNMFGAVLFLFLFWRSLKEDYASDMIFGSSIIILASLFGFQLISFILLPLFWFWFAFLGVLMGSFVAIKKYNLKIYEVIEALTTSILSWLSVYYFAAAIIYRQPFLFLHFMASALCVIIYYILDVRYKRFSWYKSGRVGFSGLTVLGIYFLARSAIAVANYDMLSFVDVSDTLRMISLALSVLVAFVSFFSVIRLSKKT